MGTAEDPGLIPRTLDVLFNSIKDARAQPCIFKADRANSFIVEDEKMAKEDRQVSEKTSNKRGKIKAKEMESDFSRRLDRSQDIVVGGVEDNCKYTVFISYIEIYQECIYDLLIPRDPTDHSTS